jgi:hypothetical protein
LGQGPNQPLPAPSSFPSFAQAPSVPRKSASLPIAAPAEVARPAFDLPKPAFRQTLMGGTQAPSLPGPGLSVPPQLGGPAYPTYQSPSGGQPVGFQASSLPSLSPPTFQGPAFPGVPVLSPPPQYSSSVDFYASPPVSLRPPSRLKFYVAFVLFMIAGGGGAYMFMTRPGMLQVAVRPQDARLAVDGVLITSDPPFQLDKRPGVYRLTVSREGYVTRQQSIQISAGQTGHVDIELEPSPDTGFDLTSQPSGGLVWLDGQPLAIDEHGKQATTNFHASRIAPGPHVIEIRGNSQYQGWRQEFLQEPGRTVRLHADLVSAAGAGKTAGQARVTAPPAVQPPPPAVQPPSVATGKTKGGRQGVKSPSGDGAGYDDVFEKAKSGQGKKPASGGKKTASKASSDEDIFESHGKAGGAAAADCTATISSKPWAEVSIDGKPTGKITPLVNYSIPCGKHRVTFKNADLMIERNESVTLKAGQPFKKIFSLVENEL